MPQCLRCKHVCLGQPLTCLAFPEGIPDEILLNKFDHHKPYPNDKGIRFELAPEYQKLLKSDSKDTP
uniref:Uncharacterized protein n=1 Tax=candidate division WOR-3 bacterium TaxID=2052148 RepID=A0A7V3NV74_UNCW3